MTIRVLIADDQALVRAGFRMIIDAQPDMAVVGEANDGAEAVELARRLLPQVVLMDVRMPTMDGWRQPDGSPPWPSNRCVS
jgi:YesN/AraC family two-component response regulator